jgi:chromosome segregation ATPase
MEMEDRDVSSYSDPNGKTKQDEEDKKSKYEEVISEPEEAEKSLKDKLQDKKENFEQNRYESVTEKLNKLTEKIKENPPKTILGKKLLQTKISRLNNIIDRKITKYAIKQYSETNEINEFKKFDLKTDEIQNNNSDLLYEKESILRYLKQIEELMPENRYNKYNQNKEKEAPKGYKKPDNKVDLESTRLGRDRANLRERLNEVETQIAKNESDMEQLMQEYKEAKEQRNKQKKNQLAVVKPNIFKKIRNFFENKKNNLKIGGKIKIKLLMKSYKK